MDRQKQKQMLRGRLYLSYNFLVIKMLKIMPMKKKFPRFKYHD